MDCLCLPEPQQERNNALLLWYKEHICCSRSTSWIIGLKSSVKGAQEGAVDYVNSNWLKNPLWEEFSLQRNWKIRSGIRLEHLLPKQKDVTESSKNMDSVVARLISLLLRLSTLSHWWQSQSSCSSLLLLMSLDEARQKKWSIRGAASRGSKNQHEVWSTVHDAFCRKYWKEGSWCLHSTVNHERHFFLTLIKLKLNS